MTGIAMSVEGLTGKLVELTLEAVPSVTRIGFLSNPRVHPCGSSRRTLTPVHAAEASRCSPRKLRRTTILLQHSTVWAKQEVQAVVVPPNGLFRTNRAQIVQLALAAHLPTIFAERENVEAGGFTSRAAKLRQSPRRNIAPTPTPREQPSDLGALGSELDTLFPGN